MRYPKFLPEKGTIGFVAPAFGCATEPYYTAFLKGLLITRLQGHEIRSDIALISNMARIIKNKEDHHRMMTQYNEILKNSSDSGQFWKRRNRYRNCDGRKRTVDRCLQFFFYNEIS